MANFGKGSIARVVITVDGLGESHLSDAYNESGKTGVDINASFYVKGQKSKGTIDIEKADMIKQTTLIQNDGESDSAFQARVDAAPSDSYMALIDTTQLEIGTIVAELKIKFFDENGNAITEVIPDVATGVSVKQSA